MSVENKKDFITSDETPCACCGRETFTPLRREDMGGYVCLPCIDKRLNELVVMNKRLSEAIPYGHW